MTYKQATPPPLYTTDSDGRYTKEVQESVYNPPHYKQGAIECIEAIQSALTEEEFRGYCKGNAMKYIWREKHKGGTESLEKAAWYLDYMMQCV
jgi:hypothetical protein